MEKDDSALGGDLIVPALALAFAIYFFVSAAGLAWEAKANGVVIGTVLIALVVLQVARILARVVRREASLGFGTLWRPAGLAAKRLGLVAVTGAFIAFLPWLGLTLGVWLGMVAQLWLIGVPRRVLVWLPLAVAAAVYGLFIAVLDAGFPRGPVEHLLAMLGR